MRKYDYFVYLMASKSRVLYTGMTNNLGARIFQHKSDRIEGFTKRYQVHRLVYFETFNYVLSAIAREKEIKHWTRQRRVKLIESLNPTWEDLAADWFTPERLKDPKTLIQDSASIRTFCSPPAGELRVPQPAPNENVRIRFRPAERQSFGTMLESRSPRKKE